jgi:multidrug efflux pump subunit AcrA (membrane-fusion protein)
MTMFARIILATGAALKSSTAHMRLVPTVRDNEALSWTMHRFVITFGCCLAGTFSLLGCISTSVQAQRAAPAVIAVGTMAAERKPIERSGVLVGRVEAVQRVEVRARVTGYLEEDLFKEGDLIKEGTPLYRIEKGLFEAAVTSAEAALERSKAGKTLSEIQLKRAQELLDRNSGTAVARDQALAADQQADGQMMGDQANPATATLSVLNPVSTEISISRIRRTASALWRCEGQAITLNPRGVNSM